jgi:hypothetical protein
MKTLAGFVLLFFSFQQVLAQNNVGIGTNAVHSSAMLEVSSGDKGILIPRMTQAARFAIASPTNGLLVFDSSTHRLYQYQDGQWQYMLTNNAWAQSTTRNWTYNGADSIGLNTAVPTERLDVNGKIKTRANLQSDNNITTSGDINANSFATTGNLSADGDAQITGNLTGFGDIILTGAASTIQLQDNDVKKAYIQLSGNDLRLGTNSGNSAGKLILRMNGRDLVSIDRLANIDMIENLTGNGGILIGWKMERFAAPDINMLPTVFGFVPADGSGAGWMSPLPNGSWTRVSVGKYEVTTPYGFSFKSAVIVTPMAQPWNLCTVTYLAPNKFRVDMFDRDGIRADGAFSFVINDPLN